MADFITCDNSNLSVEDLLKLLLSKDSDDNPSIRTTLSGIGSVYPSGLPKRLSTEITRPADTTAYTAGDSINETVAVAKELTGAAINNGGGGILMDIMLESDDVTNMAGKTVTVWLYNGTFTPIADNSPFTNTYANKDLRILSFQATFSSPVSGSTSCIAEVQVGKEYVCGAGSTSLFLALQHNTGGNSASGKKINVVLRVIELT